MKLQVMPDLGGYNNIGYERTDVPMVHVIVRAPPGAPFPASRVIDHFAACEVCPAHKVTYEDFRKFMDAQPARGGA